MNELDSHAPTITNTGSIKDIVNAMNGGPGPPRLPNTGLTEVSATGTDRIDEMLMTGEVDHDYDRESARLRLC